MHQVVARASKDLRGGVRCEFTDKSTPERTRADLEFIRRLMRRNKHALGFIPLTSIARAYEEGRVAMCSSGRKRVAYLVSGPVKKRGVVTIWQLCVSDEERLRGAGRRQSPAENSSSLSPAEALLAWRQAS